MVTTDMQHVNVGQQLSALERLTVKQFRERYAEVFGETTSSPSPAHVVQVKLREHVAK
jgi:hypothetical protein